jgi:hypothetical protein
MLSPLTEARSILGNDRIFIGPKHPSYNFLAYLYDDEEFPDTELTPSLVQGMRGVVSKDEFAVLSGDELRSPIIGLENILDNRAVSACYKDPSYPVGFVFKAEVLPNAT